ncbi:hybrid sensor histidine kinase/response regulator [Hoeflea ulvae]|uniref:histidine kinase n=1 Tax=Hoeflea ulvae TaxID=2983764 RepID=A0ABT3YLR7_9HYPH|nr:ATP-binding protein [Hoeflea ulvae]MCY0096848.1 ATP-binding protein [Hoeflea ulvae]
MILLLLSYFALQVRSELKLLESSPRDNLHWTLSQLEVDLLVFVVEGDKAGRTGKDALPGLRRRFDTLYSRVDTLANGKFFRSLPVDSGIRGRVTAIMTKLDDTIPAIDGNDTELLASLPAMLEDFRGLQPLVREISLEGVNRFAEQSDVSRKAFSLLIVQTAVAGVILIAALAASFYLLFRQYRISVRKSDEIVLANDRLKHTIDASLDPIIVTDENLQIVEYNPAAVRVFGVTREQAIGSRFMELLMADDLTDEERSAVIGLLRAEDETARLEARGTKADDTNFPIEISVGTAAGGAGTIHIAYIRDISHRIEAGNAIIAARDKALAADKAKSDFLTVMSHEMRTPLNGVMGIMQILQDSELSPDQRQLINLAEKSGETLLRHVNDVLDIARIEAGTLHFTEEELDLRALVQEVVDLNLPEAAGKGTSIQTDFDLRSDLRLAGDPVRIRQIVLNLVGNAVKFCDAGAIVVSAVEVQRSQTQAHIQLCVTDSGIGIAHEDQANIFDDFVTLDPSFKRSVMGTGLGLGITRRVAEAMGGSIKLSSSPGKGSRFTVDLPLGIKAEAERPVVANEKGLAPVMAGREFDVLVIEDNETNRLIVSRMLATEGCRVSEVANGEDGVRLAAEHRFDLILMDVSMPGMDGTEACAAIRNSSGQSCTTPIVGLTAHTAFTDKAVHAAAGFDDCMVKPLRRSNLVQVLQLFLSGRDAGAMAPVGQSGPLDAVEDDLVDTEILGELMEILPPESLSERIDVFARELETGMKGFAASVAAGERRAAAEIAHRLLGTASFLGALALERLLRDIETASQTESHAALLTRCTMIEQTSSATLSSLRRLIGGNGQ